jgi:hypothetical protein
MTSKREVSLHEVLIWNALRSNPDNWMTNQQIGKLIDGVAARTVRAHTSKMVSRGVIDMAEVFPGPRYRYSEEKAKKNPAYVASIAAAELVFAHSL